MSQSTLREDVAHLLRRFGLGAGRQDLDSFVAAGSYEKAVDRLVDFENTPQPFEPSLELWGIARNSVVQISGVQSWWLARMLLTTRPLEERLTLFWHDHFATSAAKVNLAGLMYQQNQILRSLCAGKFEDLTMEVSKDPAMLFWLDNQFNVKGRPNENFARELMELFTIGIGHYTEEDVMEAARTFTGWHYQRRPGDDGTNRTADFRFRPLLHDNGPKTIFGKTANFSGEEVIQMLCAMPETATFVVRKFLQWHLEPNPSEETVAKFAGEFRKTGLNIRELVRSVALSPEFRSARVRRSIVKNPVDFVVVTLRQYNVGPALRQELEAREESGDRRGSPGQFMFNAARRAMKGMGMELLYPPDVDGWQIGPNWISSATMMERTLWADAMFGPRVGAGRNGRFQMGLPVPVAANLITPANLVRHVVETFDAPIPSDRLPVLEEAAKKALAENSGARRAAEAVRAVAKLIFATPEFQYC